MTENLHADRTISSEHRGQWADYLVSALLLGLLVVWLLPLILHARTANTLRHGARLVESMGCLSCHRAPGAELANPGSDRRRVPTLLAWVEPGMEKSRSEIEEWIRDGHPASLRENPAAWKDHLERRIHMPAFRNRLQSRELEALVVWVAVAGGHVRAPEGAARRGEHLARGSCLPCHGVGGAGGHANPGSIAGYIPALWGVDYDDLVRDEEELKEWIVSGGSARVAAIPGVAGRWQQQTIRMPAFGGKLSASEMNDLLAYLKWLRENEGGIGPAQAGREEIDHDT